MKLHDVIYIKKSSDNLEYYRGGPYTCVMRVAGGWIYMFWDNNKKEYEKSIFVPFNNEFLISKS